MAPREVSAGRWPAAHLWAAFGALLAVAGLLTGTQIGVGWRIKRDLPFFAAHALVGKVNGTAIQAAACRDPRELPVYGSSELDRWTRNRADAFFRLRPSGFAVFPVGRGGSTCLLIAQKLAAVGNAARGRRLVVFLSPTWFLQESVDAAAVGANLGIVQINGWVFGDAPGAGLKTALARRMQAYRSALENEPLVAAGVRCLAAPTPAHRLAFGLLRPLGKFQQVALEWCDVVVVLRDMVFPRAKWRVGADYLQNAVPATGAPIDWDRLIAPAGATEPTRRSVGTPDADGAFVSRLGASQEFGDLALLVRVLRELNARALFISQPFDADDPKSDRVSAQARAVYYTRMQTVVRSGGFAVRDFAEHGDDPEFFDDPLHPSAKAWLSYDREIDLFWRESR